MRLLFVVLMTIAFDQSAFAQVSRSVAPRGYAPSFVRARSLVHREPLEDVLKKTTNGLPNIVLIGYWPPTNEMLREFNPYPQQNPSGWVGENWEGRGFNVYGFFPEFAGQYESGDGDFQVDYQKTSEDFWKIVPLVRPVAIMGFGRAYENKNWEIELVNRNLLDWAEDFRAPLLPTPNPPDASRAVDQPRVTMFPTAAVIDAVRTSVPSMVPFTDDQGAGFFLCEYLGYHMSWYRDLNPTQVRFAAFTHVGTENSLDEVKVATKASLRALIESLK